MLIFMSKYGRWLKSNTVLRYKPLRHRLWRLLCARTYVNDEECFFMWGAYSCMSAYKWDVVVAINLDFIFYVIVVRCRRVVYVMHE